MITDEEKDAIRRTWRLVVPIAGIAMQVSFLTVLGVGGFRVASGAIDIAPLVAFILFLFMMIMPLAMSVTFAFFPSGLVR